MKTLCFLHIEESECENKCSMYEEVGGDDPKNNCKLFRVLGALESMAKEVEVTAVNDRGNFK